MTGSSPQLRRQLQQKHPGGGRARNDAAGLIRPAPSARRDEIDVAGSITENIGHGEVPIIDTDVCEHSPPQCPADFDVDGDGDTDTADLLALPGDWGPH
jgi:hypothetical protein